MMFALDVSNYRYRGQVSENLAEKMAESLYIVTAKFSGFHDMYR